MAKNLDKSRDYGEVLGGSSARYEQDGALFSADGKRLKNQNVSTTDSGDQNTPLYDDDDNFPDPPIVAPVVVPADVSELDAQLAANGVL